MAMLPCSSLSVQVRLVIPSSGISSLALGPAARLDPLFLSSDQVGGLDSGLVSPSECARAKEKICQVKRDDDDDG